MAQREHLTLLGADVDLLDRLPTRSVGDLEQRPGVLAPALDMATGGQDGTVGTEDRGTAKVGGHLGQIGEGALGGIAGNNPRRGIVGHLRENTGPVSLARASWITVVTICAIAVVLFAISGYTGYSITVGAVGLAAAVNLLPNP
jgi:hypothetical protein